MAENTPTPTPDFDGKGTAGSYPEPHPLVQHPYGVEPTSAGSTVDNAQREDTSNNDAPNQVGPLATSVVEQPAAKEDIDVREQAAPADVDAAKTTSEQQTFPLVSAHASQPTATQSNSYDAPRSSSIATSSTVPSPSDASQGGQAQQSVDPTRSTQSSASMPQGFSPYASQNTPQTPPQSQSVGQGSYHPGPGAQHESTGSPTAAVPVVPVHAAQGTSAGKTFLFGFLGALLAVIIGFGASFLMPSNNGGTVLGGESSTISASEESATLAESVADKVLPSVVNIDVYSRASSSAFGMMYGFGAEQGTEQESSLGSGVILSKDGYILTNYHVVDGGSSFVVVAEGKEYEAKMVGGDSSTDLAVLKVDATDLKPIDVGSSADLRVGEWVMAVGSPFGLEQTVTTGIVSATSRSTTIEDSQSGSSVYVNMIQTDAAINPGNSGGALVDANGKLIGINTLIASSSGTSSGVGFAIPVDYAMDIAQQIIDGKTPSHAQLGVSMSTVNSQTAQMYGFSVDSGVYVNTVMPNSGAANAGIKPGDIITAVDGNKIKDASDLMVQIRSHKVGDKISVTFVREGKEETVEATLGSDS